MGREAAFFDLDRTLLRGASGPVIGDALKQVGLMSERRIPGEAFVYRLFDVIGESRPTMQLARQAARFAQGWARDQAQEAGRIAADTLADRVQPFAAPLIEQHHAAGRQVVLATTTPYDLVKPLADALGLDAVVATRYGEREGKYDGTIAGEFVWGKGKLRAVQEWAREHDVSMSDSYAYSDSWYDAPLLSAVGHPHAVNPDPRLMLRAALQRWPILHLDVPGGIPKLLGIEPQQVLLASAHPLLVPYARFDIDGTDHIPETGAAILVGNHRSYFDPMAMGLALARRGRPVRFLGKKEVFDAPVVGTIAKAFGGIRVDRGTGSDEPLRAAADALRGGQLVAMMPQGTIPRGEAFFDPVLKGRWGAARLAQMTGASVIPVGMWGTERVWPRSSRLPNVLNVTNPPLITIRVGAPVATAGKSLDADTKRIMKSIADLLPPEAHVKRTPTPQELALTYPSGKIPTDADHEKSRRPGTD
ncbi:MAG TPA: HAD-IB family hydrolase [Acidimicrobiales bacterium]|jgi:putative phosphoserine phosphatase/1-acylglycerol-3-phosphate O-acyltransferase|nr:HAD-IB family hydrolase [Acidimicrobiales bacterium]